MLDALGIRVRGRALRPDPREVPAPRGRFRSARGRAEYETLRDFEALGDKNRPAGGLVSFLGGGIYDHIVPSVVKHLAGRSEFYTAYTPYQPEVSQGTLQVIFEYQTAISRLTGLPGGERVHVRRRDGARRSLRHGGQDHAGARVLVCAEALNPRYRDVLETYAAGQGLVLRSRFLTGRGDIDARGARETLSPTTSRPWCFRRRTTSA